MFAEEGAAGAAAVSLTAELVGELVSGCVNPARSDSEELAVVPFTGSDPVSKVTVTLRDDLG